MKEKNKKAIEELLDGRYGFKDFNIIIISLLKEILETLKNDKPTK